MRRSLNFADGDELNLLCSAPWGWIMFDQWLKFASDSTMLAIEAQGVIGMRLSQMALGRGSAAHAWPGLQRAPSGGNPRPQPPVET